MQIVLGAPVRFFWLAIYLAMARYGRAAVFHALIMFITGYAREFWQSGRQIHALFSRQCAI